MLQSYRKYREYAQFTRTLGYDHKLAEPFTSAEIDKLPSLTGGRWEIDEAIFNEFRDMLPPLNYRLNSFMMREFCFGSITTKYTREGDRYYCQFVDVTKEPNQ